MDKNRLLLIWILIGTSNITLNHAIAQKIEPTTESATTLLNDPTTPKFKNNLEPLNKLNDIKNNSKGITQEQSVANKDKLKLSVIIVKDQTKSAVINDKIVREKDQILGYEIIKIESNKVILKNPKHNDQKLKTKLNLAIDKELDKNSTSFENSSSSAESDGITELKLPSINIKSLPTDDLIISNYFESTPNNKQNATTSKIGNDNVDN